MSRSYPSLIRRFGDRKCTHEKAPVKRPYVPFTLDNFFPWRSAWHTPPNLQPQTHPGFLARSGGRVGAAPSTHQAQGSMTSRSQARRLPLARLVPQKTLGFLLCPIVYHVQMVWLPHGSTFHKAHGRGVARLHNPVEGPLTWVEVGTNQTVARPQPKAL
jgi:hypothetical protein